MNESLHTHRTDKMDDTGRSIHDPNGLD